jgi:hypothetical protein
MFHGTILYSITLIKDTLLEMAKLAPAGNQKGTVDTPSADAPKVLPDPVALAIDKSCVKFTVTPLINTSWVW